MAHDRVGDHVQSQLPLLHMPHLGGNAAAATAGDLDRIRLDVVRRFDTLPGTASRIYRLPSDLPLPERTIRIAVKEHVSRLAGVHPGQVEVAADLCSAWVAGVPGAVWPVRVERDEDAMVVRGLASS
ncbi:hypothetical protein ACWCPM_34220 [Streptomyces sp. NPDC002309]